LKQTPREPGHDPSLPRNLSGVQFRYFAPQKGSAFYGNHELHAYNESHKSLGTMNWHPKTGEVGFIRAHEDYRGLGIASQLWGKAHKLAADTGIKAPKHSTGQTREGNAWAEKVGGESVTRKRDSSEDDFFPSENSNR